ncbi:hypothetical protein HNQ60_005119 [Povalibacter uvarum]|uniref:DUF4386 domain-containing protein n=1 Tax=Povalibacter uvarum TaxID=732238 RepID=A0A841HSC3_9GAMM|nr:DUF4386 domain-containing protein [Povalibacter uvarum]MBB6096197.1 hypothetical protein [Povalibacter uvarum]
MSTELPITPSVPLPLLAPGNTGTTDRRQAMARLSGFAYISYVSLGLYISFGPVGRIWNLNAVGESAGLSQADFLFRTGLVAETALYLFVTISAAAMYATLRDVDRGIAFAAAFCRLMEGAMGATFVLLKYAAFAVLMRDDLVGAFPDAQRQSLTMLFKHVHGSGLYLILIVMAVGGALFFWLFWRSRLIPRWLAGWGVFTYALMGAVAVLVILFPALKQWVMIAFLPGAVFEAIAGVWLLARGVNGCVATRTPTDSQPNIDLIPTAPT